MFEEGWRGSVKPEEVYTNNLLATQRAHWEGEVMGKVDVDVKEEQDE